MDMSWIWSHNDILLLLVETMVRASKASVLEKIHMIIVDEKDVLVVNITLKQEILFQG